MSGEGPLLRSRTAPRVSVVMPAYNTGGQIRESVRSVTECLHTIAPDCEVIVVDDGSREHLSAWLRGVDTVRVIRNEQNMGKGYSFKRGVQNSRGRVVLLIDSDMEVDPSSLSEYIAALDTADIVVASKRHAGSAYRAPPSRRFLSISFSRLVSVSLGLKLSDTQTGLKAFRGSLIRRVMNFVSIRGYAFDIEVLVVAKLMGARIAEMPVSVSMSKTFAPGNVMQMALDLGRIFYRYRLGGVYQNEILSSGLEVVEGDEEQGRLAPLPRHGKNSEGDGHGSTRPEQSSANGISA